MKKLLLLGLIFISYAVFGSGDSLNVATFSDNNQLDDDAYVWWWMIDGVDTLDYNIRGSYLQPFYRSSFTLYPRSLSYNLYLGTSSIPSGFAPNSLKLVCDGKSYFNNDAYFQNKVRFDGLTDGYIDYIGDQMYFYSATSGLYSLDQLATASALSIRNGLTTSSGYTELGGSLIKNTTIEIGSYTFKIGYESDNYLTLDNSIITLQADNRLTLNGDDITLNSTNGFLFYSNGVGDSILYYDNTTTPLGIIMPDWSTYYTNMGDTIEGAIVTLGMVQDMFDNIPLGDTNGIFDTITINSNIITAVGNVLKFEPNTVNTSPASIYPSSFGAGGINTTVKAKMFELIPTDYTPTGHTEGMFLYDDSENMIKYYNGNGYLTTIDTVSGAVQGQDFSYLHDGALTFMNGDSLNNDAGIYVDTANNRIYLGSIYLEVGYLLPGVSNGGNNYAFDFRTSNSLSGNARIAMFKNVNDSVLGIKPDSVSVYKHLVAYDSIYALYLNPVTRFGGLFIDSMNHSIKVDSTVLSSKWGLTDILPEIKELLSDKKNGEIKWIWYEENGTKHTVYNWNSLTERQMIAICQTVLEHHYRYIYELQLKYNNLEQRVESLENNKKDKSQSRIVGLMILLIALAGINFTFFFIKKLQSNEKAN